MLMCLPFLALFLPIDHAPADTLADFSRFARALNQQVSIVDLNGKANEGLLVASSDDSVTMRFGAVEETFARASVVSAERLRDRSRDGAIKGAIFGLAYVAASQIVGNYVRATPRDWIRIPLTYAAVGLFIDEINHNREPLYRAPAPGLTAKLSLRF